jgi:5-methylthioadenosine/S-adenosylhomocysteine deaminase
VQNCRAPIDILIKGGRLLTLAGAEEIVEAPLIGIRDGRILFIAAAHDPLTSLYAPREVIDATGCLIMPGLINTHTHVPMVCFRGLADDLPLMDWLRDHIFPAEMKYVSREMVSAGALLGIAEMILSGTTTFCDGYFHAGAIARAALATGMRCVAGMGILDADIDRVDDADVAGHVAAAERYLEKWAEEKPLITPALFCHSPYTCSPRTIRAIKDVARRHNALFLIHLSETSEERLIISKRYGTAPVFYLEALGVLDAMTVAVHCNWLDGEEIACLAKNQVKVSHNPQSNMKLATGVGPVPALLAAGVTVGLGTDGCASNNDHDMFGEMDSAAKLHKVFHNDPRVLSAAAVVRMATADGAKVLGLEGTTGVIAVGKEADIILVDLGQPHLTPMYNPYSQLVYAARGADVRTSIIAGKVVMKDRRLRTLDVEAAMDAVEEIAARIRKDR